MKTIALIACLGVSACATCERHPIACSIGGAIIVGTAVATIEANNRQDNHHTQVNPVPRPVQP